MRGRMTRLIARWSLGIMIALATSFSSGCAGKAAAPCVEARGVPAAYLSEVERPIPPESSRGVIKRLMGDADGREFLGWLSRMSTSWELMRGDRERVRELYE